MRKSEITVILILLRILYFNTDVSAWDDKVTHRDLSQYAAENSVLNKSKGDYLKNLGFDAGLDEGLKWNKVTPQTVRKWIQEGAELEDSWTVITLLNGTSRFVNHFHDPTKTISQAGLSDAQSGESAMLWAQDSANQQTFIKEDQTWSRARTLYRLALTSTTDIARQENFAQMFIALGHQMHLVQDMAVPEHVRNDAHLGFGTNGSKFFEKWAADEDNRGYIKTFAASPVFPTVSFDQGCGGVASVPVCRLFDTGEYFSKLTPSVSLAQGLAEYTNSNFFTDDTIFAAETQMDNPKRYFPYPKASSTNLKEFEDAQLLPKQIVAEDGVSDVGFYISKIGDGEVIGNFVRPSYLTLYAQNVDGYGNNSYKRSFYRDEECHKNYAAFLVPRAVGYSAGLLNYFFRGQMDMKEDPDNPGSFFIENKTGEIMFGTFSLYYDYEDGTDIKRELVETWDLAGDKAISANGKSGPLTFTKPTFPAPKDKDKYILVFQGRLGNEENAVAGKAVDLKAYWEGWDKGEYTITKLDKNELGNADHEDFTLVTPKHSWEGLFDYKGSRANIRVEDGMFKFDDDGTFGWMGTFLDKLIPVKDCKIKMNIPYAAVTGYYGNFWVGLGLRNGPNTCSLDYGIAEASSYWDWAFTGSTPNVWRTFIGAGEVERDIAADFQATASAIDIWGKNHCNTADVGDIKDWYVFYVDISYYIDRGNMVSAGVDYIDFVCSTK